jgi:hypothetical protein
MTFLSHRRDVAGQLLVCALACLLALLFLTQAPPTQARAAGFGYATQAKLLNQLGLYRGVSVDEFVPDLGASLNRQTGVVMLLRMFGLEAAAEAIDDPHPILARFGDAAAIAPWAAKAVAYGVENGLIVGLSDGIFGPQVALNGKAYCTLILRQLGYTPNYENAAAELADCGGLTVRQAVEFTSKAMTRDDLVGISYGALAARYADGPRVIDRLVELGVLTPEQVERSYIAP